MNINWKEVWAFIKPVAVVTAAVLGFLGLLPVKLVCAAIIGWQMITRGRSIINGFKAIVREIAKLWKNK